MPVTRQKTSAEWIRISHGEKRPPDPQRGAGATQQIADPAKRGVI